MKPAGLDRRTALSVRRDVLAGNRVGDAELRGAAEFYVDRIARSYDVLLRLHTLHIALGVMFTALFVGSLLSHAPWWRAVVLGSNAAVWTWQAIFGPSFWRERRQRLDANRRGIDTPA